MSRGLGDVYKRQGAPLVSLSAVLNVTTIPLLMYATPLSCSRSIIAFMAVDSVYSTSLHRAFTLIVLPTLSPLEAPEMCIRDSSNHQ